MSRETDRSDVWESGQHFDHPEVSSGESDTSARLCIVVGDDDAQVRRLLRMLIDAKTDSFVVGEARDGAEAIAAVDRLRPDVVILDLEMPVMGGIEAAMRIHQAHPDVHLIAFSSAVWSTGWISCDRQVSPTW